MENQKKTWETPQLVVLGRGTPQENVLTHCKAQASGGGPETNDQGCGWIGASCAACQARPDKFS
ncbi:MAG: hypothetical protein MUC85_11325 [Anaerolineales bacterium]|jgi:hypothetical protein|nr:hypothetical protein [Anaerolineales bacterium]